MASADIFCDGEKQGGCLVHGKYVKTSPEYSELRASL